MGGWVGDASPHCAPSVVLGHAGWLCSCVAYAPACVEQPGLGPDQASGNKVGCKGVGVCLYGGAVALWGPIQQSLWLPNRPLLALGPTEGRACGFTAIRPFQSCTCGLKRSGGWAAPNGAHAACCNHIRTLCITIRTREADGN